MYSLWLLPHDDQHMELAEIICQLSREYNGPVFSPHITLLSGLAGDESELISLTIALANNFSRLALKTDTIRIQDHFYRSLYIPIVKDEKLLQYRQQAGQQFDVRPSEGFMPHLSLLYGNQPGDIKEKIIHQLKDRIRPNLLFNKLELVSTSGPVSGWKTIYSFQLE